MADADFRRAVILKMVQKNMIRTQGDLQEMIKKRGFVATQATISRDIAALGLTKVFGVYKPPTDLTPPPNIGEYIKGRINNVKTAGDNMVIILTNPGEAGSVGLALDKSRWPSIVGTIAGDDTVFVACKNAEHQQDILFRLKEFAPEAFVY